MKNDKAVSYRTVYGETFIYNRNSREYEKNLNTKYGKTKWTGGSGATNVSGSNYKVRGAKTRKGRSAKYNDENYRKEQGMQLIRREYYY